VESFNVEAGSSGVNSQDTAQRSKDKTEKKFGDNVETRLKIYLENIASDNQDKHIKKAG
jgi:hypothetical protein